MWTKEARERLSQSMKKAWRRRRHKYSSTTVMAEVQKAIDTRRAVDAEIKRRIEQLGFSIS